MRNARTDLTPTECEMISEAFAEALWDMSRENLPDLIQIIEELIVDHNEMLSYISDDEDQILEVLEFDPFEEN